MKHSTSQYESAATHACQAAIMGDRMVQIRCSDIVYQLFTFTHK